MTQLTKFILGIVLSLFLSSCAFDINFGEGKRGNGNVISEDRNATETFNRISAQEGIDVYVTQGSTPSIEVEADDNVIALIRTDIKNGKLRIHAEENIGRATKNVFVTLPVIEALETSSGADLGSDIKASNFNVDDCNASASSGSDVLVNVNGKLIADASSGGDIRYSGEPKSVSKNKSASGSVSKQ